MITTCCPANKPNFSEISRSAWAKKSLTHCAISSGSDAKAAAYIELEQDGKTFWGVGIHPNTTRASFDAIIVGLSKLLNT